MWRGLIPILFNQLILKNGKKIIIIDNGYFLVPCSIFLLLSLGGEHPSRLCLRIFMFKSHDGIRQWAQIINLIIIQCYFVRTYAHRQLWSTFFYTGQHIKICKIINSKHQNIHFNVNFLIAHFNIIIIIWGDSDEIEKYEQEGQTHMAKNDTSRRVSHVQLPADEVAQLKFHMSINHDSITLKLMMARYETHLNYKLQSNIFMILNNYGSNNIIKLMPSKR